MLVTGESVARVGRDGLPLDPWTAEGPFRSKRDTVSESVDPTKTRGLFVGKFTTAHGVNR